LKKNPKEWFKTKQVANALKLQVQQVYDPLINMIKYDMVESKDTSNSLWGIGKKYSWRYKG